MTDALAPCPFCGDASPNARDFPNSLPPVFTVFCSDVRCLAEVQGRTAVRAALMWNRRTPARELDLSKNPEKVDTSAGRVYEAAEEWLPIETAPKDARVLVWTGQERYAAHWVKNPVTGDEAWLVAAWGDEGDQALVKPILWHPLTAPPVSQEAPIAS